MGSVLLDLPLLLLAPPLCRACGADTGRREPLCLPCRGALALLGPDQPPAGGTPAWAPMAYSGPARAMVAGLKFHGARRLAAPMAAQIAATAPHGLLAGAALVPVPLHPRREAGRGYNQAFELAECLARLTGLPLADCLERAGPPTTQVGRGRAERARSISGRVRVEAGRRVPSSAVIVDDVITTGSTVGACEQALRAGGTAHVTALAYARTIGR